ncbi:hypothetical protein EGW08_020044, partial [Elysia chlorotica]
PATSTATEKDDAEEVVRLAKTPESVVVTEHSNGRNKREDVTSVKSFERLHKEGKDRPLSRLGGREQFMVVKKDRDNSDDDYSDDDGDADGGERGAPPTESQQADPQQQQQQQQNDKQPEAAADAKTKHGAARKSSNLSSADVAPGHGVTQESAPTEASTQEK